MMHAGLPNEHANHVGNGAMSRRAAIKAGTAAALALAFQRAHSAAGQGLQDLPLITKPIPSTGEQLPVIGLGTNSYGVNTPEEMEPLREVLEHMGRLGGGVIDTARVYGRSEAVIGEILEGLGTREQFFIATKTPTGGDFSDPQAVLDVSFRDLRTDVIDLMLIHQMVGVEAMIPAFESAKAQGRIRYIGMSISSDDQYADLMAGMRAYALDFVEVDYSLDNRNAAESVLRLAQERGMAVLINIPFGGRGGAALMFAKVQGRTLPDWAAEFDAMSWAQVFLKYVVSHPAVTAAIPGTTQRRHLEDNLGAGRGRLPDAAMRQRIEQFWDSLG